MHPLQPVELPETAVVVVVVTKPVCLMRHHWHTPSFNLFSAFDNSLLLLVKIALGACGDIPTMASRVEVPYYCLNRHDHRFMLEAKAMNAPQRGFSTDIYAYPPISGCALSLAGFSQMMRSATVCPVACGAENIMSRWPISASYFGFVST